MQPVVEAESLVKRYGEMEAVRGITFSIERGECFAILGPNGAGKSSTIRMISCLSPVTSGRLEVLGESAAPDAMSIKRRLGIVAQEDYLDPSLTVMENLMLHGRFYRLGAAVARQRAAELLGFVQLEGKAAQRVGDLSGGMRRRLVIARALIGEPELLILDEPTTGLDPQARLMVWGRLADLRRQGVTILITTHYMEEAERLADRLVVMDHGSILARGKPLQMIGEVVGEHAVEILGAPSEHLHAVLADFGRLEPHGEGVVLYTTRPDEAEAAIRRKQVPFTRLIRRSTTLEDVFLTLTGRNLREE